MYSQFQKYLPGSMPLTATCYHMSKSDTFILCKKKKRQLICKSDRSFQYFAMRQPTTFEVERGLSRVFSPLQVRVTILRHLQGLVFIKLARSVASCSDVHTSAFRLCCHFLRVHEAMDGFHPRHSRQPYLRVLLLF